MTAKEEESKKRQEKEPMKQFLGNPESGQFNLEMHCLALNIAMKTLDENRFKNAQDTGLHSPLVFKLATETTSRTNNRENGI